MEIVRGESGITLNQRKYILDLVDSVGLAGCMPTTTPLPPGLHLLNDATNRLSSPDVYRRLVGRLLYLNLTRPYITHAVHVQQLSQFVEKPTSSHLAAAIHFVKYLKGTPSLGIFYSAQSSFSLITYSDADWGFWPATRRSLTGYCVFLMTSLISWSCKKQPLSQHPLPRPSIEHLVARSESYNGCLIC